MAVFTLETDYLSETSCPLDNSRQTNNTSQFENGTIFRFFNLFLFSVFSRQKKNKMCAGIIFEQGLIRATFLVVHTFAHLSHCG